MKASTTVLEYQSTDRVQCFCASNRVWAAAGSIDTSLSKFGAYPIVEWRAAEGRNCALDLGASRSVRTLPNGRDYPWSILVNCEMPTRRCGVGPNEIRRDCDPVPCTTSSEDAAMLDKAAKLMENKIERFRLGDTAE